MKHLTKIGVVVNCDGGLLFITACITFLLSVIILFKYRRDIPFLSVK